MRRTLDRLLLFGLAATLLMGVAGLLFSTPADDGECRSVGAFSYFTDPLYHLFLLFELGDGGLFLGRCYDSLWIGLARFAGPVTVLIGVARLFWGVITEIWQGFRLSRMRDHVVIAGFGDRGRAIAAEAGRQVVAIDVAADEEGRAFVERQAGVWLVGDARDPAVLRRAKAGRAHTVIAGAGDDIVNLKIAAAVESLADEAPPRPDVRVMVSDPLIRRGLAEGAATRALDPLSVEDLAARTFADHARLHELCDLMGAPRLHVLLQGEGRLICALAGQILRTSVMPGLDRPRLTVMAEDPGRVIDQIRLAHPGAGEAAELAPVALDPCTRLLDAATAETIAQAGPVTALVVAGREGADALQPALALRDALRRLGVWRAPIFFAARSPDAVAGLARPLATTARLAEVFEPFAVSPALCAWPAIAALDATARAIHENYLDAHRALSAAGQAPSAATDSLAPWDSLSATYKRSNRRAAAHAPAKLLAAGAHAPPGPVRLHPSLRLTAPETAERLAALEHAAWNVDRLLEGWRPGPVRDNAALVHDCLYPFEDLPPATQDLDREQIAALDGGLLPRREADGARWDLWVGLVGSTDLSEEELAWWRDTVGRWTTETLGPAAVERHVTLVSPLAPGADLVAAQAAGAALTRLGLPWRLVSPRAVRLETTVADFETRWKAGAAGLADRATDWPAARERLLAAAEALAVRPGARIVDLPAADSREGGYQRQSLYIARRCEVLLAALKSRAERPGGTAETLRWRAAPGSAPAGFSPRLAGPPTGLAATYVADVPGRTLGML
ncbi:MAG: NAD-binding protein [Caulobacteraceae bacterium]|nr:NAD-binding protein [Caulobacteraceae bacterium]